MSEHIKINLKYGRFLSRSEILSLDQKLAVGDTAEIQIRPALYHGILGLSKPQMIYRLKKVLGKDIDIKCLSNTKIKFIKVKNSRAYTDTKNAKTLIGIVSSGKNLDNIERTIVSANKMLENKHIIISGDSIIHEKILKYDNVQIIDPCNYISDGRFLISKKKNDIIKKNEYCFDYAIIIHDHYILDDIFWTQYLEVDVNFDFLITRKRNIKSPKSAMHGENERLILPFDRAGYLPILYPQREKKSELHQINGGILIGSQFAFSRLQLDEQLAWGEMEDLDFSVRSYFEGLVTKYDPEIRVLSSSNRLSPVKYEIIQILKQYFRTLLDFIKK